MAAAPAGYAVSPKYEYEYEYEYGTAVRFSPQGDALPRREQRPAAMFPGRIHGLYVVDVIDGEWVPVCLTTTAGPATARRGGGPGQSPFEVPSKAKGLSLSGVGFHWRVNSHSGSRTVSQR